MTATGYRRPMAGRLGRMLGVGWCALAVLTLPARAQWRTLPKAHLDETRFFDGDSFTLVTARSTRVYRLYFVDAPETDLEFPDRVKEQADYFGISVEAALRIGHAAKEFVREFMRDGVTVYHRRQDAGGRTPRYFAIIRSGDGRYLCEALVEAGLARIHGLGTDLPDGTPEAKHWAKLRAAERRARAAGVGAWGERSPRSRLFPRPPVEPP